MAKNGQKWPKIIKKVTFFEFHSVYAQNDRNFVLILNLSLIFEERNCQNCQKRPKMTKNGPKSPKNDLF